MNLVHYTVDLLRKGGDSVNIEERTIMDDSFQLLLQADGLARVSTTYQRALKYGEEKVVVTVSCTCDQNGATIDRAGELTFRKALELVDNNFGLLEEDALKQAEKIG